MYTATYRYKSRHVVKATATLYTRWHLLPTTVCLGRWNQGWWESSVIRVIGRVRSNQTCLIDNRIHCFAISCDRWVFAADFCRLNGDYTPQDLAFNLLTVIHLFSTVISDYFSIHLDLGLSCHNCVNKFIQWFNSRSQRLLPSDA